MAGYNNNFVLLTAQDLRRMMTHKNQMIENRTILENSKATTLRERDQLRQQLTDELAKGDINIEEITQNIVAERLNEANQRFEEERSELQGFLQQKINRNLELEVNLDEIKDAYRALESSLSQDEKKKRNREKQLETSLEQISTLYQTAMNERSILKVDLQVSDRKH